MARNPIVARAAFDECVAGYVSPAAYVDDSGESWVQQSDFDRSDINLIVERFVRTGVLESVRQTRGEYGDFSQVTDYASSLRALEHAQESFMTLPATVRRKFDDDPALFLDFVGNPANEQEMYEMGLFNEDYRPRQAAEGSAEAAPKE